MGQDIKELVLLVAPYVELREVRFREVITHTSLKDLNHDKYYLRDILPIPHFAVCGLSVAVTTVGYVAHRISVTAIADSTSHETSDGGLLVLVRVLLVLVRITSSISRASAVATP